jgi:hypothetical protein
MRSGAVKVLPEGYELHAMAAQELEQGQEVQNIAADPVHGGAKHSINPASSNEFIGRLELHRLERVLPRDAF